MTPYEIGILMHYHCRPDDYPEMQQKLFQDTVERFMTDGVLAENLLGQSKFEMTDRGHAYCRALQSVPLPQSRWVMTWPEVVK